MTRGVLTTGGVAIALVWALAGCVSGQNYRIPSNAVAVADDAKRPFTAGDDAAYTQADPPDRWWELYEDPRLDAYVVEALKANTDLRMADANLRRVSALVLQAQAGRTIQANVQASATAAHVGGYTLPMSTIPKAYALGIDVSYPLDLAGGIQRGIEAASANEEAAKAARDHVRVVVAAAVTRGYVSVCSSNRTLAASRHVLDIQRETHDATAKLTAGGRGTEFDVSRSSAAVNGSAAAIPRLLADRQTALFELAALMGRVPRDYPKELETCGQPPVLKRIPIGDGWHLIRRRPDIREAERHLAAATATVGVETSQLYPQVSIGASVGFANSLKDLFSAESFGATIGPRLSWHWPNREGVKARIDAAGANADVAFAAFDGSVLQALKQTETALSAYAQEVARERSLAQARDAAAHATEQANRLHRFGRVSFLDILSAEASLASAESALASSRAQLIDRQIDLFLALGGGWSSVEQTGKSDDREASVAVTGPSWRPIAWKALSPP